MTDYLSVRDLSVRAVIGAHPWEREVEQTLHVSVDMVPETAGLRQAAAVDELTDALDYSAVADVIAAVLREGKFRLIETAAERVAGRLLADFPLTWLRLELRKPVAAGGYTAIITLERVRENPLSPGTDVAFAACGQCAGLGGPVRRAFLGVGGPAGPGEGMRGRVLPLV